MKRATEKSHLRQRSFIFAFSYFTVCEEGVAPAPWQHHNKQPDQIKISECSSVLALSLEGPAKSTVRLLAGRRRQPKEARLYDTFAPWHLLNIQHFPDGHHSIRTDLAHKPIHSGPYAFMASLASEYKDALKRYKNLTAHIMKLITPSVSNHYRNSKRLTCLTRSAVPVHVRREDPRQNDV